MLIGHSRQREELEQSGFLPAVLLLGPSGVGKWLAAAEHAERRGGAALVLRDGPTVEQAREVVRLFRQRPTSGRSTVLVDLDACSEQVQHILLKTVEEMPEWGQILLVASGKVLPTIRSRCHHVMFYPLSDQEVAQVLESKGFTRAEAEALSDIAWGSVERALRMAETGGVSKQKVLQWVDAVARVDRNAVVTLGQNWSDNDTQMLWRWCLEVLADWPEAFTRPELELAHTLSMRKFSELVDRLRSRQSPELVAMEVWKLR